MRVLPSSEAAPWLYAGTRLDEPASRPTVDSVMDRASRFRRDGFIDIGSRVLWYIWQRDPALDQGTVITRAYATSVIALGCIAGGPPEAPPPTEAEFRLLCRELHLCEDFPRVESAAGRVAHMLLTARQSELPISSMLRRIPADQLAWVVLEHSIGLVTQMQSRPFAYQPSDIVRPFLVYEQFRNGVPPAGLASLDALERAFFRMDPVTFLRSVAVAWAVGGSDAVGDTCPGRINVAAQDGVSGAPLGVEPRDLAIAFETLGTRVTAFRNFETELRAKPEMGKKYDTIVRRLDTRPVVILDDYPGEDMALAVPSPWHLRAAITEILLDEFVEFCEAHRDAHPLGVDARSLRGTALENYLRLSLADCQSVRRLGPEHAQHGQHPDFLWLGQKFGLLIEAKIRLTPVADAWGRDAASTFEAWRRAGEACEQAAAFLARGCDGLAPVGQRRWLVLIVTLQPLAAEVTAFRTAAKRWGLLAGTGLDAVAVVSPAELEHFALAGNADAYASRLAAIWEELDPDSLQRPSEGVPFRETRVTRAIVDGWQRLFPGARVPWSKRAGRQRNRARRRRRKRGRH